MASFERIKAAVTMRQAAEYYGVHVNRHGFACCPFHHEKTPSMKVDTRLYCDYLHLLKRWKEELPPKSMDKDPNDRFVEALHNIDWVEYFLVELWDADNETRQTIIKDLQPDMERIAKKPELSRFRSRGGPSL